MLLALEPETAANHFLCVAHCKRCTIMYSICARNSPAVMGHCEFRPVVMRMEAEGKKGQSGRYGRREMATKKTDKTNHRQKGTSNRTPAPQAGRRVCASTSIQFKLKCAEHRAGHAIIHPTMSHKRPVMARKRPSPSPGKCILHFATIISRVIMAFVPRVISGFLVGAVVLQRCATLNLRLSVARWPRSLLAFGRTQSHAATDNETALLLSTPSHKVRRPMPSNC